MYWLIHQIALAQSHTDTSSILFTHMTGEYFIRSFRDLQCNIPLTEAKRPLMGMSRPKQKPQCRVSRRPALRQKETASQRKTISQHNGIRKKKKTTKETEANPNP